MSCQTALIGTTHFPNVIKILKECRRGLAGTLSAFEVMCGSYFHAVTWKQITNIPMSRKHKFYVLLEAEGSDLQSDEMIFQGTLENLYMENAIKDAVVSKSKSQRLDLRRIREDFEVILKDEPAFLYDVSLPIVTMEEYVNDTTEAIAEKWALSNVYALGHISDGNIHFFVHPNVESDSSSLHESCDALLYEGLKHNNGSISAEHGIGIEKKQWLS